MTMTTEIDCCKPVQMHSPSGLQWRHRRNCPADPYGFIRYVKTKPRAPLAEQERMSRRHRLETASKGVPVTKTHPSVIWTEVHPACRVAAADGSDPCSRCAWLLDLDTPGARYFEAHLDDGRDGVTA